MAERFKTFMAVCTHKYSNWLIQDEVTDFIGAMNCFDKYELADARGSETDDGIAVSAAVARPERMGAEAPTSPIS